MKIFITVFFTFIGFLLGTVFSQGKANQDRKQFMKEFTNQIASGNDKEADRFVDKELKPLILNSNDFPEEKFQQMAGMVEQLKEKKHATYPYAYKYVQAFYAFVQDKRNEKEFTAWHEMVERLMENRNPKRIRDFLTTSGNFFYNGVIYETTNFQWHTYSKDYEFFVDETPFIRFNNVTLVAKSINLGKDARRMPYTDSLKIHNTSGVADLNLGNWKGEGGTCDWEKVGLRGDKTNVKLKSYKLSFKSTSINADSVEFKTPLVGEIIPGKFADRAFQGSAKKNQNYYPQFISYRPDYEIKNLIDSVDYKGGISYSGEEFIGMGNKNKKAELIYYRKGKPFIKTFSDQVRLSKEQLKTPMARFSLYIGSKDSIFHTGLNITYDIATETITFNRGSSAISQSPFLDSYHKMSLYVEHLSFHKKSPIITLGYDKNASDLRRTASFESFDYYNERLYQEIQGMEAIHPLAALYNYAWKYDKFEMDEGTASTALQGTVEQAKPTLLKLATLGFISYDTEAKIVIVNDKTEKFVKAKSKKIDYDNIAFKSDLAPIRLDNFNPEDKRSVERQDKINRRNQERAQIKEFGTLNLSSLDLTITAVDFINIEDATNTSVFPENHTVIIKENRDIHFHGWIESGKWEINIEQGNYDYSNNKFNIFNSDMALFKANPLQKEDGKNPIPIQSVIVGVKGELIVNDVNNRAAIKRGFADYPKLIVREKTKVFYDHQTLYRGAYEKDRFYFELEPFSVDSLASFNERNIRFPGTLISAGIFPQIKDKLKIMPDYSLGFSKDVPKDGYQFYGTTGKYNNKILLSNNGLQGGGTIDFINSTSTSKRLFTFLPDSAIGIATFVNLPKESGVQFPDANGDDVFMTFIPKKEILRVQSNNEPIAFYGGEANLQGTATLRKNGMKGKGYLDLPNAKMFSNHYQFTRWETNADTSNFVLTNKYKDVSEEEDPLALKAENVAGNLNFKERKGIFKSNEGESIVEFPANQYYCKINQFTWLMDDDEMVLESNKEAKDNISIEGDLGLAGSNFFSIHPRQDSLQFRSPKARFNLKERTIYGYDVDFLDVADARLYPDSGKVVVRRKAKMDEFNNAKIVVNYITKYHNIVNVTANVTGRKAYTAVGDYEYGKKGDEKQLIKLDEIKLDPSFQTIASGKINKTQNFQLSQQFDFYGDISLFAAKEFLAFKGATKVNHTCSNFERNWMAFEAEINPANIQIPIGEELKDLEGKDIAIGIRWRISSNPEDINLYPTFLSSVVSDGDPIVISSSGFLQYDSLAREFQIASKEKLINRGELGNYISLHTESCSMNADGQISLGMDFGPLTTDAVGVVNYNHETDETTMNLTLAIRAPLYEKAFETAAEEIRITEGLSELDFNTNTLENALAEWIDVKTADRMKSNYALKGEFKPVPKEIQDAIVITGLKLTANAKKGDNQRGLKTVEHSATLVNFFKEPVLRKVPLKFFVEQRVNIGDRLALFLDIPGNNSYFIDYDYRKEGMMNILTNNETFKSTIEKLKPTEKKEKRFMFDVTPSSAYQSQFFRVFE